MGRTPAPVSAPTTSAVVASALMLRAAASSAGSRLIMRGNPSPAAAAPGQARSGGPHVLGVTRPALAQPAQPALRVLEGHEGGERQLAQAASDGPSAGASIGGCPGSVLEERVQAALAAGDAALGAAQRV